MSNIDFTKFNDEEYSEAFYLWNSNDNSIYHYRKFNLRDYLATSPNYDYSYRILKNHVDNLFYAFENARLVSLVGEESYRVAMRRHVVPLVVQHQKEGKTCGEVYYTGTWDTADRAIDIKEYFYEGIKDEKIMAIIDNWNQDRNMNCDAKKVNPHQLSICPQCDITIQMITGIGEPNIYYFINGIPLSEITKANYIFKDGIPVGVMNNCINLYVLIAEAVLSGNTFTIIKDNYSRERETRYGGPSLEKRIAEEISRRNYPQNVDDNNRPIFPVKSLSTIRMNKYL